MQRFRKRIAVAVSAVVAVVGAFIGSGAAGGTPIQDAAGGALSASSTAIAPDGPAFGIWSVIYVGLIAFAVLAVPPHRDDQARHDRLAVPAVLSLLLNAAWILSVQFGFLWASEPIIVALLVVLVWAFAILRRTAVRRRRGDRHRRHVRAVPRVGLRRDGGQHRRGADGGGLPRLRTRAGRRGVSSWRGRRARRGPRRAVAAGVAWRRWRRSRGVWRGSRSLGSTGRSSPCPPRSRPSWPRRPRSS